MKTNIYDNSITEEIKYEEFYEYNKYMNLVYAAINSNGTPVALIEDNNSINYIEIEEELLRVFLYLNEE